jgi:signal transduction histidine kinase
MSSETRRRIFEPFFTTKSSTGTGLGLWVSSEILRNHHAYVRIRSSQSADRHGTIFSIFFPMYAAET